MDNSVSQMMIASTVQVTYDDGEGTWSEAIVIPTSPGLDDQDRIREYLELEKLKDHSRRDRTILNPERIEDFL